MTRKSIAFWSGFAVLLSVLFLMSSTDLIIRERGLEVYPVSVIIDDTSDDYYVNIKKGIDRAAGEYNIDVNFISLYENSSQAEQLKLAREEIEAGARAVVMAPLDREALIEELGENALPAPLIILGEPLPGMDLNSIAPDYRKMGAGLAERIAAEQRSDTPVYIFTHGMETGGAKSLYEGMASVLGDRGFRFSVYDDRTDGDIFREMIEKNVYPGSSKTIIAALDKASLTKTSEILSQSTVYSSYVLGLYGAGSSTYILNKIEGGTVNGVYAWNEYDMGYMAMSRAVECISAPGAISSELIESYYVDRDILKSGDYMKLLYPIE